MSETVSPIPTDHHTITPYLSVKNTPEAVEFYTRAFNAKETARLVDPTNDSVAYCHLQIGSSSIMLSDEVEGYDNPSPETLGGTCVRINLFVEDVDATFAQAVAAGAQGVIQPANQFYGDRSGRLIDPFGHIWIVSSRIEIVSAETMQQRFNNMVGG